jgi:hypothetical protein
MGIKRGIIRENVTAASQRSQKGAGFADAQLKRCILTVRLRTF